MISIIDRCVAVVFKEKTPDQLMEERLEDLLIVCEIGIERNLKDPHSFKRINSRYEQMRTGIIKYTATNIFGGRVAESFKCFDP